MGTWGAHRRTREINFSLNVKQAFKMIGFELYFQKELGTEN